MSGLLDLATRCEAASGADRELDGAIDRQLHMRPKHGDYDESERAIWRVTDAWSGLLVRGDGFARGSFCAAAFTTSLDVGITLAEGSGRSVPVLLQEAMERISGLPVMISQMSAAEYAQTLARYFTAACLRALAAKQPTAALASLPSPMGGK
jgi:hypothetical protein